MHVPRRTRRLVPRGVACSRSPSTSSRRAACRDVRRADRLRHHRLARARQARHHTRQLLLQAVPRPRGEAIRRQAASASTASARRSSARRSTWSARSVAQVAPPKRSATRIAADRDDVHRRAHHRGARCSCSCSCACCSARRRPARCSSVSRSGSGSYAYPARAHAVHRAGHRAVRARRGVLRDPRVAARRALRSARVRRVRGRGAVVPRLGRAVPPVDRRCGCSSPRGARGSPCPSTAAAHVRVRRVVHGGRGRSAAAVARRQLVALRQRDELRLRARHRDRPVVPDRARRRWTSGSARARASSSSRRSRSSSCCGLVRSVQASCRWRCCLLGAHRGREHAVLRARAVLVGRLGVGPALHADRRAVPRGDGRAADGLARAGGAR